MGNSRHTRRNPKKTGLTRRTVYEIITQSGRLKDVAGNPQRFIDLAAEAVNRSLYALMTAGIEYEQTGEVYDQKLLEDMEREGIEFYENDFTFEVGKPQKPFAKTTFLWIPARNKPLPKIARIMMRKMKASGVLLQTARLVQNPDPAGQLQSRLGGGETGSGQSVFRCGNQKIPAKAFRRG